MKKAIQLTQKTKLELRKLSIKKRESYESVITRLIKYYKKNNKP